MAWKSSELSAQAGPAKIHCPICDQGFENRRAYRTHLWFVHRTRPKFVGEDRIQYCPKCQSWHRRDLIFCDGRRAP